MWRDIELRSACVLKRKVGGLSGFQGQVTDHLRFGRLRTKWPFLFPSPNCHYGSCWSQHCYPRSIINQCPRNQRQRGQKWVTAEKDGAWRVASVLREEVPDASRITKWTAIHPRCFSRGPGSQETRTTQLGANALAIGNLPHFPHNSFTLKEMKEETKFYDYRLLSVY